MNIETLKAKRDGYRKQREEHARQAQAQDAALLGAIQALEELIAELEAEGEEK